MGFLNKLMLHLNTATTEALDQKNNSLEKKLYAFLCKMLEAGSKGNLISNEVKNINQDVVFFVLNGTDIRNSERAFVAALNRTNLSPEVIGNTLLVGTNLESKFKENKNTNKVLLYSTNREGLKSKREEVEQIDRFWNVVWQDYLKLTTKSDKINLFTLNHWLLKKTKQPLNIGFYWGQEVGNGFDESYFYLTGSTLRQLGISDKNNANFLKLNKDFTSDVVGNATLKKIQRRLGDMKQIYPALNTLQNVGFSVYHLLRSYGCWGGNSFYSIPINYGSIEERRIGILSLCTKKPLDENLVLKWSLAANKIFKDIILHEIHLFKEFEKKSQFMETTYSLGHNIKNRVLEGDSKLEAVKLEVEKLIDDVNETRPEKIDKTKILEQISNVGLQVKSLSNTGNFLDLVSKSQSEKKTSVFSYKDEWHKEDEVSLLAFITSFYVSKFYVVSKQGIYGIVDIEQLSPDIKISPWLVHPETRAKIRPHDFIYEEIFFELFVNALSYGESFIDEDKNCVQINVSNEDRKIVVANVVNKPINTVKKFRGLKCGKELPVHLIGHGGLRYIDDFLTNTHIGSLRFLLNEKTNKFNVILRLRGLSLRNAYA